MHEHWLPMWREGQRTFFTPNNFDLFTPESAAAVVLTERINEVARHFGLRPEKEPRQQVTFELPAVEHIGPLLRGETEGEFYARSGFTEQHALEQMLIALEAGYHREASKHLNAAVFPSGMAAIDAVARELVRRIPVSERANKRVLRGTPVYPQTERIFDDRMREYGFSPAMVVDTTSPQTVARTLETSHGNIVAVFYESVSNLRMQYTDTRAIGAVAHEHNVPVIVDNTLLSPYLQQPFRMGADIVIESLTKYILGWGHTLAGAVIGPEIFMRGLKELQVQSGAVIQSPAVAHQMYRDLRTFPQRMDAQVKNAGVIASVISENPSVKQVYYPTTESGTRFGSPGAVISFELAGATPEECREREAALMQVLIGSNHYPIVYSVGFGDERYRMVGLSTLDTAANDRTPGLVRFAVGREPKAEEIIPFLKHALEHACR